MLMLSGLTRVAGVCHLQGNARLRHVEFVGMEPSAPSPCWSPRTVRLKTGSADTGGAAAVRLERGRRLPRCADQGPHLAGGQDRDRGLAQLAEAELGELTAGLSMRGSRAGRTPRRMVRS